jgi:hypothetical protein
LGNVSFHHSRHRGRADSSEHNENDLDRLHFLGTWGLVAEWGKESELQKFMMTGTVWKLNSDLRVELLHRQI